MSALLAAAMAFPPVALLGALLIGRWLRAADRRDEHERTARARALVLPAPLRRARRPIRIAREATGSGGAVRSDAGTRSQDGPPALQ